MSGRAWWIAGAALLVACGACDGRSRGGGTANAGSAAGTGTDSGAGAGAGAGAGVGVEERAEGEEWRAVARHEAAARVGQVTTASFSAMGKDPWKVNVEFPAKLEVLAAGRFTPAAQVLRRDAAARLDEHELRFDLGLTPQEAGEHPVEFKLKFGVCNAERCVTREAVFRWTYRVEAP